MLGIRHHSNVRIGQIPFLQHLFHFLLSSLFDNHQHTLLAFAEQQLPTFHVGLTHGHFIQPNIHSHIGFRTHFTGRASNSRRAHILHSNYSARFDNLHARLQNQLLPERITHLNRWQIRDTVLTHIFRCESCTMNSVLTRSRTKDINWISRRTCTG